MGAGTAAVLTTAIVENPPVFPSIELPDIRSKSEAKSKSETKDISPAIPQKLKKDPVHHIVA